MSGIQLIADLHFGHEKVAELRGFSSVEEHDQKILGQLQRVPNDDTLIVLGDISSGKNFETEHRALMMLATVPAKKRLIAGNHDSVSSIHKRGFLRQRDWLEVFESVEQFARITVRKQNVLMSHYPYDRSGDGPGRGPARYSEYRLPDVGLPLIHGHTHHSEPHMVRNVKRDHGSFTSFTEEPDLQQFCVSWDAHRRLVTQKDLDDWILRLNGMQ